MISPDRMSEFQRASEANGSSQAAPATASPTTTGTIGESPETLRDYLASLNVKVSNVKKRPDGSVVLILDGCPMNPDHGHDSSTAVVWRARGIGFKCQHHSCAEHGWRDVACSADIKKREPAARVDGRGWITAREKSFWLRTHGQRLLCAICRTALAQRQSGGGGNRSRALSDA